MKRDFTASAERALTKAGEIAAKLGTTALGTEHLLYGLSAWYGIQNIKGKRSDPAGYRDGPGGYDRGRCAREGKAQGL